MTDHLSFVWRLMAILAVPALLRGQLRRRYVVKHEFGSRAGFPLFWNPGGDEFIRPLVRAWSIF
jgi:hypothetical protein